MLITPAYRTSFHSAKQSSSNAPATNSPRVWALLSNRIGDNAQVMALMEALRLPYEVKTFSNRPGSIAANLAFGPKLPWMVRTDANSIAPPWPHLVVAAGTQSEPLCAIIKEYASRDNGHPQFVFLGRPWRSTAAYDLVVTTPQYDVPPAPNVVQIDLPLHRVTADVLMQGAATWSFRLSSLRPPYVALIVGGGNINRYTLDAYAIRRLAYQANKLAESVGGSLLISSSFRTPPEAMRLLTQQITCPSFAFDWANSNSDNPYFAFLGLASHIIVTGDSITMLAEACATGRPVYIFDLGEGRFSMRPDRTNQKPLTNGSIDLPWALSTLRAFRKDLKVRVISKLLPKRLHRNTGVILERLVQSGAATWLGDQATPGQTWRPQVTVNDVANRVVSILAPDQLSKR